MAPMLAWLAATIALGVPAGLLVARAAAQLPAEDGLRPRPALRLYALAVLGCVLAAAWAAAADAGPAGLVGAALGWQLVLLAILDVRHFWLPHRLTIPLGLMGLAQAAAFEPSALIDRLIGAAGGMAALVLVAWTYRRARGREGLGGGDARLLAAAGAWIGWMGLPSVLLIAAGSGLALAGAARLAGRRIAWSDRVPFGLFLALGLWLTWLYGPLRL